jgi:hypothetical protein
VSACASINRQEASCIDFLAHSCRRSGKKRLLKVRASRLLFPVLYGVVLLALGCRSGDELCPTPELSAHPQEIPEGVAQTQVSVEVEDLEGFETRTELQAISGAFADRYARETVYTCAHDATGPVEICVNSTYAEDGGADGALQPKLRRPHAYLLNPLECSTTRCIDVICPEQKNECPVVSSLTVEPEVLGEDETAAVTVVAEDPDDNPQTLVTTLSTRYGTIAEPNAKETTYACDRDVGGIIEVCVTASDGDSFCDVKRCTGVLCPGEPLENTCPIINSVTANPVEIPSGQYTTVVSVDSTDPDAYPVPLRNEWSSDAGFFMDRFASETTFTCGQAGPITVCARANDGDPSCNETSCTTVQCPVGIRPNQCPELFVINAIPRMIAPGENSTRVQTRAQDTDGLPSPLTLTLNTLWGSFENTANIQEPLNVVAQNATYVCDRPGVVEICVDAADGLCTKTLCDTVVCPDDISTP